MSLQLRNHYIPQFYLKGFTMGSSLWVHDWVDKRSYQSQPKSVANEKGLYPEEVEKHLAESIENPAKRALQMIRNRSAIGEDERRALAKYMVTLWKRVPKGLEGTQGRLPEVAASIRDDLKSELDAAVAERPDLADVIRSRYAEANQALVRYEVDPPRDIWHMGLAQEASQRVVESMLSMHWRFLVSDTHQFLTCDNPVFFFEFEGIEKATSEITFPISSTVALWATRRVRSGPMYLPALPVGVREVNRRSAQNSTRYVFSMRFESWILPFSCKRQYSLNRLQ